MSVSARSSTTKQSFRTRNRDRHGLCFCLTRHIVGVIFFMESNMEDFIEKQHVTVDDMVVTPFDVHERDFLHELNLLQLHRMIHFTEPFLWLVTFLCSSMLVFLFFLFFQNDKHGRAKKSHQPKKR